MNESEIQKKLEQKRDASIPEPIVETTTENTLDAEETEVFNDNSPLNNIILKQQTMLLLGVPEMQRNSTEIIDRINYILRWAIDNSPSSEMSDIIATIDKQTRMMGIHFKEDKMMRLYQYTKLNNQRNIIETQMRSLYA